MRAPELAFLELAVEGSAPTVAGAEQDAREKAARAAAALSALKLSGMTTNVRMAVLSDQAEGEKTDAPAGEADGAGVMRRVECVVAAQFEAPGSVARAIDAGLQGGAARVCGVWFGLKDDRAAKIEAVGIATRASRERAVVLAGALGLNVGLILEVRDGPVTTSVRPVAESLGAGSVRREKTETTAREGWAIEARELTITASVEVVYTLRGAGAAR